MASEKLEEVRPGCKIYGANLYLTAFDADGVPFDLVDHRGESLIITLATPSGQLVRPALTAEGQARKDMRRAEVERRRIEEEERWRTRPNAVSPIAETARLEAATETLAEYIGYLNGEIDTEQEKVEPNPERITALEHELDIVLGERRALTPSNRDIINRALYVYAPMLRPMRA